MQKATRINIAFPVGTLIGVALFRMFLLVVAFYSYVEYNKHMATKFPLTYVLNFTILFPLFIVLAEAMCYYIFRKRYFQKKIVRWHIWLSVLSSLLLPLITIILILYILPFYVSEIELINISKRLRVFLIYGGWIIFAFARLFFIIAMRTSVTVPSASEKTTESTGYLDEFSNQ